LFAKIGVILYDELTKGKTMSLQLNLETAQKVVAKYLRNCTVKSVKMISPSQMKIRLTIGNAPAKGIKTAHLVSDGTVYMFFLYGSATFSINASDLQ
jgi:hypothetical protein